MQRRYYAIIGFILFLVIVYFRNTPTANVDKPTAFDIELLKTIQRKADTPTPSFSITPIETQKNRTCQTVCSLNGRSLFYYDSKIDTGAIILNGKHYLLTFGGSTAKSGTYSFKGPGIVIWTTLPDRNWQTDNDNCESIIFPYMVIEVGGDSLVLKGVELQNCACILPGI